MTSHQALHETLKTICQRTHGLLQRSHRLKHTIREETLTDINLLDIEWKHGGELRAKIYNRHEEGRTSGADWLWIINGSHGEPPTAMLMQAKLISKNGKCYTIAKRSASGKEQIEQLEDFAAYCGFYSFYCFYGCPGEPHTGGNLICTLGNQDLEMMACTILPSLAVRRLIAQRTQPSYHEILPQGHSLACVAHHCATGMFDSSGSTLLKRSTEYIGDSVRRLAREYDSDALSDVSPIIPYDFGGDLTESGRSIIEHFMHKEESLASDIWSDLPLAISSVMVIGTHSS